MGIVAGENCFGRMCGLNVNVVAMRYVRPIYVRMKRCIDKRSQSAIMDKWGLLAALQALSIYILIRLDEGETEHNNLDSLLLITVVVCVASKL